MFIQFIFFTAILKILNHYPTLLLLPYWIEIDFYTIFWQLLIDHPIYPNISLFCQSLARELNNNTLLFCPTPHLFSNIGLLNTIYICLSILLDYSVVLLLSLFWCIGI